MLDASSSNLVSLSACTDTFDLSELHLLWLLCPLEEAY
jgi:hypothetical protein